MQLETRPPRLRIRWKRLCTSRLSPLLRSRQPQSFTKLQSPLEQRLARMTGRPMNVKTLYKKVQIWLLINMNESGARINAQIRKSWLSLGWKGVWLLFGRSLDANVFAQTKIKIPSLLSRMLIFCVDSKRTWAGVHKKVTCGYTSTSSTVIQHKVEPPCQVWIIFSIVDMVPKTTSKAKKQKKTARRTTFPVGIALFLARMAQMKNTAGKPYARKGSVRDPINDVKLSNAGITIAISPAETSTTKEIAKWIPSALTSCPFKVDSDSQRWIARTSILPLIDAVTRMWRNRHNAETRKAGPRGTWEISRPVVDEPNSA